jgi:hypothetical protein
LLALSNANTTRAQDGFYEVETKYIFGFTEGSGVGLEGEKEFSVESLARIGKADGRYWASETKLEYEFTPNQYVQFELGPSFPRMLSKTSPIWKIAITTP